MRGQSLRNTGDRPRMIKPTHDRGGPRERIDQARCLDRFGAPHCALVPTTRMLTEVPGTAAPQRSFMHLFATAMRNDLYEPRRAYLCKGL